MGKLDVNIIKTCFLRGGFFFLKPRGCDDVFSVSCRIEAGNFYLREGIMNKRLGFVGIIIEDRKKASAKINNLLSEYGNIIAARVGVPYKERNCCVITLVVDATTDELGSLTGKLGAVEGVSVKSALGKERSR